MNLARLLLLSLLAIFISGCASVPTASMEEDADAKSFRVQDGKAALYIYRNESFGGAIPMTVNLNGRTLGQTAAKTYFKLDLSPGNYNIESIAENTSSLQLALEPSKSYFVWQEVKMGFWMARSLLQQVPEATGRQGVLESKLIKANAAATSGGQAGASDLADKLKALQDLYDRKLISEREYNEKRTELLKQL